MKNLNNTKLFYNSFYYNLIINIYFNFEYIKRIDL